MPFITKTKFIYYIAILAITISLQRRWKTTEIPDHLVGHPAGFHQEFIDVETQQGLLKLIKEMKVFPTNVNDLLFYNRSLEDIGESMPISPDGTCSNSFLVPNTERTKCVLPGRFDLARHFILYGGLEGLKENFTILASRIQSFGRYMFDLNEHPIVKKLFTSEKYLSAVKDICPHEKQVVDPFQFNFIIQVPGQTVPIHMDAPYFEDATRFQYPQWLLVAMVGSGLYQDKFIDQGVGYLHEWNRTKVGGQFAYFDNNDIKPVYERPIPRSVILLDGSKTMHAATLYRPKFRPPVLNKDSKNELVFNPSKDGDETWEVRSNDEVLKKYDTSDLRITIVYRARCFETEEKREKFNSWYKSGKNARPVEKILDELKAELVRKKGYERKKLDAMSRFELATVIVDEFIKYRVSKKFGQYSRWNSQGVVGNEKYFEGFKKGDL